MVAAVLPLEQQVAPDGKTTGAGSETRACSCNVAKLGAISLVVVYRVRVVWLEVQCVVGCVKANAVVEAVCIPARIEMDGGARHGLRSIELDEPDCPRVGSARSRPDCIACAVISDGAQATVDVVRGAHLACLGVGSQKVRASSVARIPEVGSIERHAHSDAGAALRGEVHGAYQGSVSRVGRMGSGRMRPQERNKYSACQQYKCH